MAVPEGVPDAVIVDPPRAGLRPGMVDALISLKPENIIYVSCNPFTLARDTEKILNSGYSIRSVTPVNVFPRTEHVETVVRLSRQ